MTARRHRQARRVTIVLLAALSGCGAPMPVDRPVVGDRMTARIWGLRDLQGSRVAASDPEAATLRFLPGHDITGTAGCNHVGGREHSWSADAPGTAGTFAHDPSRPTIRTVAGCRDRQGMETGNRFWDMMATARGWSLSSGTLTIGFADGSRATLVPVGKVSPPRDDCDDPASRNLDCRRPAGAKGR